MRVLYVMKRFHTNHFFALKALRNRGHDVHMFVQTLGRLEDHSVVLPQRLPPSRLNVFYMPILKLLGLSKARARYELPSITAMVREMRRINPDVVILKKMRVHSKLASLVALLQRRDRILFSHAPMVRSQRKMPNLNLRGLGLTPGKRYSTISGVAGPDKPLSYAGVYHIPLPVEPPALEPPPRPLDPGCIKLLCVGKYEMVRKRQELLLEIFADLSRKCPIMLTFVGSGSTDGVRLRALKKQCETAGLQDRVSFLLNLPYQEMLRTYLEHDVLALPARDEPYGMVVLEAMAYGMPVICSDSCGSRDCLEVGVNGEIYRTDDVTSFRKAVESIVSDPERLRSMGRQSLRIVQQRHTPAQYHDRLLNLVWADKIGNQGKPVNL